MVGGIILAITDSTTLGVRWLLDILFLFGVPAIGSSTLVFLLHKIILSFVKIGGAAAIDGKTILVKKNLTPSLQIRRVVAHELSHFLLPRFSLQEAVARLRILERWKTMPENIKTAYPDLVSLVETTPVDQLQTVLKKRAKKNRSLGNVIADKTIRFLEPYWSYLYSEDFGDAVFMLTGGDFIEAYEIVRAVSMGMPLKEALEKNRNAKKLRDKFNESIVVEEITHPVEMIESPIPHFEQVMEISL